MKKPINIQGYKSKVLQGEVVSSGKMSKTIIVKVYRKEAHPLYGKIITKFTKLHVHDAEQTAKVSDIVEIKESRPISKTKSWVLFKIIKRVAVEKVV